MCGKSKRSTSLLLATCEAARPLRKLKDPRKLWGCFQIREGVILGECECPGQEAGLAQAKAAWALVQPLLSCGTSIHSKEEWAQLLRALARFKGGIGWKVRLKRLLCPWPASLWWGKRRSRYPQLHLCVGHPHDWKPEARGGLGNPCSHTVLARQACLRPDGVVGSARPA